jgi:hypothetical protein
MMGMELKMKGTIMKKERMRENPSPNKGVWKGITGINRGIGVETWGDPGRKVVMKLKEEETEKKRSGRYNEEPKCKS